MDQESVIEQIQTRIEEIKIELEDEPNNSHIASRAGGELDGLLWVLDLFDEPA